MSDRDFAQDFKTLTGHTPFPWQVRLFERMTGGGDAEPPPPEAIPPEPIPAAASVPTGLGKTSVIAVWLLAWLERPDRLPRRLAYVVNRRTVVDQTTQEVKRLRKNLAKLDRADLDQRIGAEGLAVSTLRGQFADNRAWSADPSRPAVVCGTVDMIGSRLLFSGYRAGFKSRPMQAGFLGQDTLLVHDEAHLEPAFQKLVEVIRDEQRRERDQTVTGQAIDALPWEGLGVMELSATARWGDDEAEPDDGPEPFTLDEEDMKHEEVRRRLGATKRLSVHTIDEKKLAGELAEHAVRLAGEGAAVLVFARQVTTVDGVVKALHNSLDKAMQKNVQVLIGPMRGHEREQLAVGSGVFARFLPESDRPEGVDLADGPVFLVCTAAGEVGVNLSADHLACDLTPLDSMIQRLGRVNRFGKCDDTRIEVLAPTTFDDKGLNPQREKTLAWLEKLDGDASPAALGRMLGSLSDEAREAAFTPTPTILPVSDILFDAWSMTSLQPPRVKQALPGCPPVEPYLHGVAEWDPPQTHVAWRWEVGWYTHLHQPPPPEELLADYPLKPHELLSDRSDRVADTLLKRIKNLGPAEDPAVWVVGDHGQVKPTRLRAWDGHSKKSLGGELGGKTLLLPPDAGMLSEQGRLDDSPPREGVTYDVADLWRDDEEGHYRRCRDAMAKGARPKGAEEMRRVRRIEFEELPAELKGRSEFGESDPDDPPAWDWYVRPRSADDDGSRTAPQSQDLYGERGHLHRAEMFAAQCVGRLNLGDTEATAVTLAAAWHDLGKDRELWQAAILNRAYPKEVLAKSDDRMMPTALSQYRHEFGSVLDVLADEGAVAERFAALPEPTRDLLLHLIAAHHGRARPHFTGDEAYDPGSERDDAVRRDEAADELARETPRRFARLQRKYGRWGLAYLESLVRAADYAASAAPGNEAAPTPQPEAAPA